MKNIFLLLCLFFISCTDSSITPKEFISNARKKNINILFNVAIEARGIRDDSLRYYYSHNFVLTP